MCYRNNITPVPMLVDQQFDREAISDRLNNGLSELVQQVDSTSIEYAEFQLDLYFTTNDDLAIDPETVKRLMGFLEGAGLNTSKAPLAATQDIFPSADDCFDWVRMKDVIWRRGEGYRLKAIQEGDFDESLFILHPITREYSEGAKRRNDGYNQRTGLHIDLKSAVLLSGDVVLGMVREQIPQIDLPLNDQPDPYLLKSSLIGAVQAGLELRETDTSYEDWQVGVFEKFGFGAPYSEDGMSVLPPNKSDY